MSDQDALTILQQHVHIAFSARAHPGDTNIVDMPIYGDCERSRLAQLFHGKTWQQVGRTELIKTGSGLSFFSQSAFRYFLPAFMLGTIRYADDVEGLTDSLINSLFPSREPSQYLTARQLDLIAQFTMQRIQGLQHHERLVVLEFLELVNHAYTEWFWDELTTEALTFWRSFACYET